MVANFAHFVPDPDKVEGFGEEDCAVNHALEITRSPRWTKIFEGKGPGPRGCCGCLGSLDTGISNLGCAAEMCV
jgi:hypothetical protein